MPDEDWVEQFIMLYLTTSMLEASLITLAYSLTSFPGPVRLLLAVRNSKITWCVPKLTSRPFY